MSNWNSTRGKASEAYLAKLRDPRWQKKRLQVLERDGWACQMCGDSENTLHVHHRYYSRGVEPWDYLNDVLVTLCAECHEAEGEAMREVEHDLIRALKLRFWASDLATLTAALLANRYLSHPAVPDAIALLLSDKNKLEELMEQQCAEAVRKLKEKRA